MIEKKTRRLQDYLEHILNAIERIELYVSELDQAGFLQNMLVQDAVIRNFEVIGEAASKIQSIDPDFGRRHPHLRLDLAYRMRNALIHGYDAVNLVIVWNTIQSDVPVLKQQMINMVRDDEKRDG